MVFEDITGSGSPRLSSRAIAAASSHLAITSVFGPPLEPSTWSGAPANIATALRALGYQVSGIQPRFDAFAKSLLAGRHLLSGHAGFLRGETVRRGAAARRHCALMVERERERIGAGHILHTGTFDLPVVNPKRDVHHYLFCDHTWDLARRHHAQAGEFDGRQTKEFEVLERESYAQMQHIFTFGRYVRDNLVQHYGLDPARVTAIGSGMGRIRPHAGAKDYVNGPLLFVAKHLFVEKGGRLVLDAFRIVRKRRPSARLVIVGSETHRSLADDRDGVEFHAHLPWNELERLYHQAALLVQPMLNDPWGQVYLEALLSRTPVVGLRRNGLPEILDGGRHGFLVDVASPDAVADAVVEALSNPSRLLEMGWAGQRHVLTNYSWDRAAARMHEAMVEA
jgi:glycosyltransferase involved in cell wall biosynthesis